MAADRHSMSAVDAAWMRMDRPTNLMVVVGVLVLDKPLDFARFRELIATRFLRFGRFRCRPVDELRGAAWKPDARFDLDAHLRRVALPGPAGQAELEALVSDLAGTQLDRRRPLWQFHFIEHYAGGTAVIVRIHHCYADGIALARVFMSLTDDAPPLPVAADGDAGLAEGMIAEGAAWLGRLGGTVLGPQSLPVLAGRTLDVALELARVAALPDDPATPLKGPLGTRKVVAWAPPLPLADVRSVARALGCTVNDVVMAAAAGALGDHLREAGERGDDLAVRATVPFNLRDPREATALGNQFGLVFLELPVGIRDPLERVRIVHERMRELKRSPQPSVMLGLMTVLGAAGETLQSAAVDLLSRKATLVATNVPGPTAPLSLAGRQVSQAIFFVPQSGDIGLGLSILSYAGAVQLGVLADRRRMGDPRGLVTGMAARFEEILLAALMGPYLRRA